MGQAKRLKELEKENSRLKRVERGTSPVYALGWLRGPATYRTHSPFPSVWNSFMWQLEI